MSTSRPSVTFAAGTPVVRRPRLRRQQTPFQREDDGDGGLTSSPVSEGVANLSPSTLPSLSQMEAEIENVVLKLLKVVQSPSDSTTDKTASWMLEDHESVNCGSELEEIVRQLQSMGVSVATLSSEIEGLKDAMMMDCRFGAIIAEDLLDAAKNADKSSRETCVCQTMDALLKAVLLGLREPGEDTDKTAPWLHSVLLPEGFSGIASAFASSSLGSDDRRNTWGALFRLPTLLMNLFQKGRRRSTSCDWEAIFAYIMCQYVLLRTEMSARDQEVSIQWHDLVANVNTLSARMGFSYPWRERVGVVVFALGLISAKDESRLWSCKWSSRVVVNGLSPLALNIILFERNTCNDFGGLLQTFVEISWYFRQQRDLTVALAKILLSYTMDYRSTFSVSGDLQQDGFHAIGSLIKQGNPNGGRDAVTDNFKEMEFQVLARLCIPDLLGALCLCRDCEKTMQLSREKIGQLWWTTLSRLLDLEILLYDGNNERTALTLKLLARAAGEIGLETILNFLESVVERDLKTEAASTDRGEASLVQQLVQKTALRFCLLWKIDPAKALEWAAVAAKLDPVQKTTQTSAEAMANAVAIIAEPLSSVVAAPHTEDPSVLKKRTQAGVENAEVLSKLALIEPHKKHEISEEEKMDHHSHGNDSSKKKGHPKDVDGCDIEVVQIDETDSGQECERKSSRGEWQTSEPNDQHGQETEQVHSASTCEDIEADEGETIQMGDDKTVTMDDHRVSTGVSTEGEDEGHRHKESEILEGRIHLNATEFEKQDEQDVAEDLSPCDEIGTEKKTHGDEVDGPHDDADGDDFTDERSTRTEHETVGDAYEASLVREDEIVNADDGIDNGSVKDGDNGNAVIELLSSNEEDEGASAEASEGEVLDDDETVDEEDIPSEGTELSNEESDVADDDRNRTCDEDNDKHDDDYGYSSHSHDQYEEEEEDDVEADKVNSDYEAEDEREDREVPSADEDDAYVQDHKVSAGMGGSDDMDAADDATLGDEDYVPEEPMSKEKNSFKGGMIVEKSSSELRQYEDDVYMADVEQAPVGDASLNVQETDDSTAASVAMPPPPAASPYDSDHPARRTPAVLDAFVRCRKPEKSRFPSEASLGASENEGHVDESDNTSSNPSNKLLRGQEIAELTGQNDSRSTSKTVHPPVDDLLEGKRDGAQSVSLGYVADGETTDGGASGTHDVFHDIQGRGDGSVTGLDDRPVVVTTKSDVPSEQMGYDGDAETTDGGASERKDIGEDTADETVDEVDKIPAPTLDQIAIKEEESKDDVSSDPQASVAVDGPCATESLRENEMDAESKELEADAEPAPEAEPEADVEPQHHVARHSAPVAASEESTPANFSAAEQETERKRNEQPRVTIDPQPTVAVDRMEEASPTEGSGRSGMDVKTDRKEGPIPATPESVYETGEEEQDNEPEESSLAQDSDRHDMDMDLEEQGVEHEIEVEPQRPVAVAESEESLAAVTPASATEQKREEEGRGTELGESSPSEDSVQRETARVLEQKRKEEGQANEPKESSLAEGSGQKETAREKETEEERGDIGSEHRRPGDDSGHSRMDVAVTIQDVEPEVEVEPRHLVAATGSEDPTSTSTRVNLPEQEGQGNEAERPSAAEGSGRKETAERGEEGQETRPEELSRVVGSGWKKTASVSQCEEEGGQDTGPEDPSPAEDLGRRGMAVAITTQDVEREVEVEPRCPVEATWSEKSILAAARKEEGQNKHSGRNDRDVTKQDVDPEIDVEPRHPVSASGSEELISANTLVRLTDEECKEEEQETRPEESSPAGCSGGKEIRSAKETEEDSGEEGQDTGPEEASPAEDSGRIEMDVEMMKKNVEAEIEVEPQRPVAATVSEESIPAATLVGVTKQDTLVSALEKERKEEGQHRGPEESSPLEDSCQRETASVNKTEDKNGEEGQDTEPEESSRAEDSGGKKTASANEPEEKHREDNEPRGTSRSEGSGAGGAGAEDSERKEATNVNEADEERVEDNEPEEPSRGEGSDGKETASVNETKEGSGVDNEPEEPNPTEVSPFNEERKDGQDINPEDSSTESKGAGRNDMDVEITKQDIGADVAAEPQHPAAATGPEGSIPTDNRSEQEHDEERQDTGPEESCLEEDSGQKEMATVNETEENPRKEEVQDTGSEESRPAEGSGRNNMDVDITEQEVEPADKPQRPVAPTESIPAPTPVRLAEEERKEEGQGSEFEEPSPREGSGRTGSVNVCETEEGGKQEGQETRPEEAVDGLNRNEVDLEVMKQDDECEIEVQEQPMGPSTGPEESMEEERKEEGQGTRREDPSPSEGSGGKGKTSVNETEQERTKEGRETEPEEPTPAEDLGGEETKSVDQTEDERKEEGRNTGTKEPSPAEGSGRKEMDLETTKQNLEPEVEVSQHPVAATGSEESTPAPGCVGEQERKEDGQNAGPEEWSPGEGSGRNNDTDVEFTKQDVEPEVECEPQHPVAVTGSEESTAASTLVRLPDFKEREFEGEETGPEEGSPLEDSCPRETASVNETAEERREDWQDVGPERTSPAKESVQKETASVNASEEEQEGQDTGPEGPSRTEGSGGKKTVTVNESKEEEGNEEDTLGRVTNQELDHEGRGKLTTDAQASIAVNGTDLGDIRSEAVKSVDAARIPLDESVGDSEAISFNVEGVAADDIWNLKYRDLRALCKEHNLPATGKLEDLRERLIEFYNAPHKDRHAPKSRKDLLKMRSCDLKECLRKNGLSTEGRKKELQSRLSDFLFGDVKKEGVAETDDEESSCSAVEGGEEESDTDDCSVGSAASTSSRKRKQSNKDRAGRLKVPRKGTTLRQIPEEVDDEEEALSQVLVEQPNTSERYQSSVVNETSADADVADSSDELFVDRRSLLGRQESRVAKRTRSREGTVAGTDEDTTDGFQDTSPSKVPSRRRERPEERSSSLRTSLRSARSGASEGTSRSSKRGVLTRQESHVAKHTRSRERMLARGVDVQSLEVKVPGVVFEESGADLVEGNENPRGRSRTPEHSPSSGASDRMSSGSRRGLLSRQESHVARHTRAREKARATPTQRTSSSALEGNTSELDDECETGEKPKKAEAIAALQGRAGARTRKLSRQESCIAMHTRSRESSSQSGAKDETLSRPVGELENVHVSRATEDSSDDDAAASASDDESMATKRSITVSRRNLTRQESYVAKHTRSQENLASKRKRVAASDAKDYEKAENSSAVNSKPSKPIKDEDVDSERPGKISRRGSESSHSYMSESDTESKATPGKRTQFVRRRGTSRTTLSRDSLGSVPTSVAGLEQPSPGSSIGSKDAFAAHAHLYTVKEEVSDNDEGMTDNEEPTGEPESNLDSERIHKSSENKGTSDRNEQWRRPRLDDHSRSSSSTVRTRHQTSVAKLIDKRSNDRRKKRGRPRQTESDIDESSDDDRGTQHRKG